MTAEEVPRFICLQDIEAEIIFNSMQDTTIVKLKHNIEKMERLLEKQERRFAVGFDHLKTKVELMNKMATKAESEIYKNHLDQGNLHRTLYSTTYRMRSCHYGLLYLWKIG